MSIFFRGIFRQSKPRQFSLPPRYYDERKERLDQLKAKQEEKDADTFQDTKKYREHLRNSWDRQRKYTPGGSSTFRILLIFAALLVLTYYFLLG